MGEHDRLADGTFVRLHRQLLVLLLVLTMVPALPAWAPDASAQEPTARIAGDDRFDTSARIAVRSFPDRADTVYLANAFETADALAAGTLTDGPILLVPTCGAVPTSVADQIDRLDPNEVIALGGPGAICEDLLQAAAGGATPRRLGGTDRFGTAALISQRAFPDGSDTVYVAFGFDSPDAVAGGALTDGPILLVTRDQVPDAIGDEIDRLDPDEVIALGGPATVPDAVLASAAGGRDSERLAGDDRYETSVEIAERAFGGTQTIVPTAYLARGDQFADAVAAGSLRDGPVLLVPRCAGLPESVADYLEDVTPFEVIALGGAQAICDDTLDSATSYRAPAVDGTLVLDDALLEVDLEPDQPRWFRIDVPAGTRFTAGGIDYASDDGSSALLTLYAPDGNEVRKGLGVVSDQAGGLTGEFPTAGSWLLEVEDASGSAGGTLRLAASTWRVVDLEIDGADHDHDPDRPGAGFDGRLDLQAGRRYSVVFEDVTVTERNSDCIEVEIVGPNGEEVVDELDLSAITCGEDFTAVAFDAAADGTHRVWADEPGATVRLSVRVTAWDREPIEFGDVATKRGDRPGRGLDMPFDVPSANTRVTAWYRQTADQFQGSSCPDLELFAGVEELASAFSCGVGPNRGMSRTRVLDAGSHRLLATDGGNGVTGTAGVSTWIDESIGSLPGSVESPSGGVKGQGLEVTFGGSAGQDVTLEIVGSSADDQWSADYELLRPSGNPVDDADDRISQHGNDTLTVTLPDNGTYRLLIDANHHAVDFTVHIS